MSLLQLVVMSCLLPSPLPVGGGGPHPHRVVNSGDGDGRKRIAGDNDENKYRRKNPMEMLSRWFKLVNLLLIHPCCANGSLIPSPMPGLDKAGRAWYISLREQDVIDKWQHFQNEDTMFCMLFNHLHVQRSVSMTVTPH